MNAWVYIIAYYGLPFAIDLAQMLAGKPEPGAADFEELGKKYGTKTAEQYLAEARGRKFPPVE